METKKSYCRICQAFCAIEVDVEDGQVLTVRGDRSDPMTEGFTCIKGRQLPYQMNQAPRLRASQRRRKDGGFEAIATERALDSIAAQLKPILDTYGPRSIATYCGTQGWFNSSTVPIMKAWHEGLHSPSYYSSVTIDKPARFVAIGRMGMWGGGFHSFQSADVVLVVGCNPLVSCGSWVGGIPNNNPAGQLKKAKQRGLKLICVDPRRSETARQADIHLQVKPGEDATLFAGLIRIIIDEELYDATFCNAWVDGLDALWEAVRPFTPDYVEQRAKVPAAQLCEAARLFGRGPRGCASSGVGTEMAPGGRLTESLILALNMICGRVNREGEKVADPAVLGRAVPRFAMGIPPEHLPPLFRCGEGAQPRVRGLSSVCGELPAGALSDEILTPGEGQVRALICVGGNPLMAFPDQRKTKQALEQLDLLVCVDPYMSATAQLANFIIAPRLPLEREDVTILNDYAYERPYAHYTPRVVDTELDVIEEWELFLGLAKRMGVPIKLGSMSVDFANPPTKAELLQHLTAGSRVPIERVRAANGGCAYDEVEVIVAAPPDGFGVRLNVAPLEITETLSGLEPDSDGKPKAVESASPFSHLLICSRLREVINSSCHDFPRSRKKWPTNPAFLSPEDLRVLNVAPGDVVQITSDHGTLHAVVESDDGLARGVIAMAHGWGVLESGADVREVGASLNLLIADDRHVDPITGMPRQSAIPVNIAKRSGH